MAKSRLVGIAVVVVVLAECGLGFGQHLKWNENEQVQDAVTEAVERLRRPSCLKLLGPDATAALLSANYRLIPLGEPKLHPTGKFQVISAVTMRQHKLIIINKDGPFMNPTLSRHGKKFNYGFKDVEFRALLLLHELGHLIDKFDHDADDPSRSRFYTELVMKNCFQ